MLWHLLSLDLVRTRYLEKKEIERSKEASGGGSGPGRKSTFRVAAEDDADTYLAYLFEDKPLPKPDDDSLPDEDEDPDQEGWKE